MCKALLLAALTMVVATGCAKEASEGSSPSPGVGGDVQLEPHLSEPDDATARARAEADAQRRAQAIRMRQQLRDQGIDGSVAVGIAAEAGYKITTLQAEEAAEAVRLGLVEGGKAVVIERSAPVQITTN
jgi:hypothetical protein